MPRTIPPVAPAGRMRDIAQPHIPLEGGLVARPWQIEDADQVIAAFEDPDIRYRHMRTIASHEEFAALIEERQEGWRSETDATWAVVNEEGLLHAYFGLHDISLMFGCAEVGYWVVPHARRQSVATRMLKGMSRWVFDDLGLHRLVLIHGISNDASCRVAIKTGYLTEGTYRSALLHEDGWHDMHIHARIADDG